MYTPGWYQLQQVTRGSIYPWLVPTRVSDQGGMYTQKAYAGLDDTQFCIYPKYWDKQA